MNDAVQSLVSVAIAIVGLAIIAVIVSKNAQTPQVVQSFTQGFAADIGAAVSPVTGGSSGGFGGITSPIGIYG